MLTAGVETSRPTSLTLSYGYFFIFQAWNLRSYLKVYDSLPSQGRRDVELIKSPTSWNII